MTEAEILVVERIKVLTGFTDDEIEFFFHTLMPIVAARPSAAAALLRDVAEASTRWRPSS